MVLKYFSYFQSLVTMLKQLNFILKNNLSLKIIFSHNSDKHDFKLK